MEMTDSSGTCPPLTLNNVVANTTTRDVGTVVSLQCEEGFELKRGTTIVECLPGAYWSDAVPYCREEKRDENNDQILIIIISAAATAVALGILICGIYILITNMRKEKKEKQEDSPPPKKDIMETLKDLRLLNDAPQDSVGMPAVIYGNMNTILRGRVESSENETTASPVSQEDLSSAGTGSEKVFIY